MIEKIKALVAVFQTGQMVANPVAWKKNQIAGGLVAGFLGAVVSLSKVFGYDIPLTDSQLLEIGGAIVAVFGLFNGAATVVSTGKLGLSPRSDGQSDSTVAVDSPSLAKVPAVPAPAAGALHTGYHTETGAWLDGPAEQPLRKFEPVDRSFTGGG